MHTNLCAYADQSIGAPGVATNEERRVFEQGAICRRISTIRQDLGSFDDYLDEEVIIRGGELDGHEDSSGERHIPSFLGHEKQNLKIIVSLRRSKPTMCTTVIRASLEN